MYNDGGGGILGGGGAVGGGAATAGGLAATGFSVMGFAVFACFCIVAGLLLLRAAAFKRTGALGVQAPESVDPFAALAAAVAATGDEQD